MAGPEGSLAALLVGACFLLARVLRIGWVTDSFSRPVLIGYMHGVAVVLVVGQLGELIGAERFHSTIRDAANGRNTSTAECPDAPAARTVDSRRNGRRAGPCRFNA